MDTHGEPAEEPGHSHRQARVGAIGENVSSLGYYTLRLGTRLHSSMHSFFGARVFSVSTTGREPPLQRTSLGHRQWSQLIEHYVDGNWKLGRDTTALSRQGQSSLPFPREKI